MPNNQTEFPSKINKQVCNVTNIYQDLWPKNEGRSKSLSH
ncbi:uncharacterized protein METZ01_LOCUS182047, partial [marine metagenome]